jgi:hypothetical protein
VEQNPQSHFFISSSTTFGKSSSNQIVPVEWLGFDMVSDENKNMKRVQRRIDHFVLYDDFALFWIEW